MNDNYFERIAGVDMEKQTTKRRHETISPPPSAATFPGIYTSHVPYYGNASSITMRPLEPASRLPSTTPYTILRSDSNNELSTAFDKINQRLSNIEEKLDSLSAKINNQKKQIPTELLEELDSLRNKILEFQK
jgi:hypothetical protein